MTASPGSLQSARMRGMRSSTVSLGSAVNDWGLLLPTLTVTLRRVVMDACCVRAACPRFACLAPCAFGLASFTWFCSSCCFW